MLCVVVVIPSRKRCGHIAAAGCSGLLLAHQKGGGWSQDADTLGESDWPEWKGKYSRIFCFSSGL